MKSGDIRSFFGGGGNKGGGGSQNNKPPASNSQNSSKQGSDHKEAKRDDKRKADDVRYDQSERVEHQEKKRLKKVSELDQIGKDMESIVIDLTRRGPRKDSPVSKGKSSVQKPTYTSDDLDSFKFGDKNKRKRGDVDDEPKAASGKSLADIRRSHTTAAHQFEPNKRGSSPQPKREPPRRDLKTITTMELEEDDGNGTDVTEVISDGDNGSLERTPSRTPTKSAQKPKEDKGGQSLRALANKYGQNKPVVRKTRDEDEEDDMEEEKETKGKRGKSSTAKGKGKSKVEDTTIQGPLSGNTIVITGVMDGIKRDPLIDLLKVLGAKVTGSVSSRTSMLLVGSVLEDGRTPSEGNKYKTAVQKGTKILTESEFDDLIYKKTGKRMSDGIDAFMVRSSGGPASGSASGGRSGGASGQQQQQQASSAAPVVRKKKPGEKSTELWTQKYAPKDVNDVIGNQNFIKDIMTWLKDWHDVVVLGNKKEVKGGFGRNKDNWGTSNVNAKACLISGPPGIGKTTAVRLIAKKMGYDIIEQNASDVRNKKAVGNLLGHLTNNTLLCSNRTDLTNPNFIILMDECDGMSAGDRGGNQALIAAIKNTKTPIICICNDRQNNKIRSLANYCYDLKFHKPPKQTIAKRLAEICANEGLSVDMNSLEYMCENFGNDIRQMLNLLQMYARKNNMLTYADAKSTMGKARKDDTVMMNNFDAARRIMTGRDLSVRDKTDLFFIDYDLIPLLVQENYLPAATTATNQELENICKAADALAQGDVVNRKIRQYGDWGLMPNFAFLSSIYPCEVVKSNVAFPKFPEWLGKNSSSRKKTREVKELRAMMAPAITGNRLSVLFDYVPAFMRMLHYNINNVGDDREMVENIIEILDHYHMELEVAKEYLPDLQLANAQLRDPFIDLSTQTKSMLTRTYNSRHKTSIAAKKAKRVAGGGGGEGEAGAGAGHKFNPEAEEDEEEEEEEHPDEENEESQDNVEIKGHEVKKGKGKAQGSKAQSSASKGSAAKGGKGKKK